MPPIRKGPGRPQARGSGQLLTLIRLGQATTKADLVSRTGFARATINKQIAALQRAGLIFDRGAHASGGAGRPAAEYELNRSSGVVLVADLGVTGAQIAACDLTGVVLARTDHAVAMDKGPQVTLDWVTERFADVLKAIKRRPSDARGIGVGLPGPVDFTTGLPVSPPLLPGWDGFPIRETLGATFNLPIVVDSSANLMALGEFAALGGTEPNMVFVRAATGIGCGIIVGGKIYRGAHGAAGDIGHIRLAEAGDVLCGCGHHGCLEALAGGAALTGALEKQGLRVRNSREVVKMLAAGRPEVVRLVRQSGRLIGQALSALVSIVNPGLIVVGGDFADADPAEHLLTGIREVVYERALPLATRRLRIAPSVLRNLAAITGGARLAIDRVFDADEIERRLA